MVKNRRRQYFINRPYQGRFIAVFMGACLAGIVVCAAVILYYINADISAAIFHAHLEAANTSEIILPVALKTSLLFFLLGVFVIALLAFYYSKKADGLVEGMTDGLEKLRDGRLDFVVQVGQYEEFPELERLFNDVVKSYGKRVAYLKGLAEELDSSAAALTGLGRDQLKERRAGIGELGSLVQGLKRALDVVKVRPPGD